MLAKMEFTQADLQPYAQYIGQIVPRSFNVGFIALSYVVSLVGAGSTLELINRRTSPKGTHNQYGLRHYGVWAYP